MVDYAIAQGMVDRQALVGGCPRCHLDRIIIPRPPRFKAAIRVPFGCSRLMYDMRVHARLRLRLGYPWRNRAFGDKVLASLQVIEYYDSDLCSWAATSTLKTE